MLKSKLRRIKFLRYEIIIMILIIICISYNLIYEGFSYKGFSYSAISITRDGIISVLNDDEAINEFKQKNRPIIYFNKDACEFISVYDNYVPQTTVLFNNVESLHDNIWELCDWVEITSNNEKGEVDISKYGLDMKIKYEWVSFADGTRYLIVYNTNITKVKMFNIFNMTCYLAIVLSFLMLINIVYWQYRSIVNMYSVVNTRKKEIM